MAKTMKIWYDKEGDFLEMLFSDAPGYMCETQNDHVMERVDDSGKILGYSILGISNISKDNPITAELEVA
jgi:uncharacterized protein YuzE